MACLEITCLKCNHVFFDNVVPKKCPECGADKKELHSYHDETNDFIIEEREKNFDV